MIAIRHLAPATPALMMLAMATIIGGCTHERQATVNIDPIERQITSAPCGHVLTNTNVWSPDGKWIVYDCRSDALGEKFDSDRIERVNVDTGQVQVLYEAKNGAHVGVVTYSPVEEKVVFIQGPENPTADWSYGASHRQGVIVNTARPGIAIDLDARDMAPPFTPGALRGGSHVHVFSPDGKWVSFTYEDAVLPMPAATISATTRATAIPTTQSADGDISQRNVGVAVLDHPVAVSDRHPRNRAGSAFSVLVTKTTRTPTPGSDKISKAFEDAWIGTDGYVRPDGTRQRRSIAFQGNVVTADAKTISEVFVVDLPDDLLTPDSDAAGGALEGTATTSPRPPRGARQRRLTFTADRAFPGIQGPRHWLRSSPDGSTIAFLMRDAGGVAQLWGISPNGGATEQLTFGVDGVSSCFNWNAAGDQIAYASGRNICVWDRQSGQVRRFATTAEEGSSPSPLSVCFSPDGSKIAYIRSVMGKNGEAHNQIFVSEVDVVGK